VRSHQTTGRSSDRYTIRSLNAVRYACELVLKRRIGTPHDPTFCRGVPAPQPVMRFPKIDRHVLDCIWRPTQRTLPFLFRYISIMPAPDDRLGAHDNDIAQWGNGTSLPSCRNRWNGTFPTDAFGHGNGVKSHYTRNGVKLICPATESTGTGSG